MSLVWRAPLLLTAFFLTAATAASAQAVAGGAVTTESGSYLNLGPRQRMTQPALVQAPRPAPAEPQAASRPERSVVCGTTVLKGDNAVDRKMVLTPPEGAPRAAARRYQLPLCSEPTPEARRR